jgi:hypothetical protein
MGASYTVYAALARRPNGKSWLKVKISVTAACNSVTARCNKLFFTCDYDDHKGTQDMSDSQ